MEAWQLQGGFGLDQLAVVERPVADPARGQVLLRMRALSVNYRDLLMVRGHYNPRQRLPLVPMSDGVGEVVAVGDGVCGLAVGDRVCPIFVQGWRAGELDQASARTALGGPLDGVAARYVLVDAGAVVSVPPHLTDAEAACLPCAGVTAWRAVVTEAGVGAGDRVLTLGTGGVSLFALQIAKLRGAQVAVTSSQDAKLDRARELGADFTLNYVDTPRWGKAVVAWTGGRGVDAVVELGGAGTLKESLRAVRHGGHIALIGVLSGVVTELPLTSILMRGVRVQGIFVGHREDFSSLCRALAAHPSVRPVVDRVFPWTALPEALRYLASGQHFGKVVVEIDPG